MDYESFVESVRAKGSYWEFRPDPAAGEFVEKIVDAARYASSGFNSQPFEFVVIEAEMPEDAMGLNRPYALRTLVTDKARLTICGGIENAELYDLENDPDEMNNLFD